MKVCLLFHKFSPENEGISISIDRLTKNLSGVEFHIVTSKLASAREDILVTSIETTKTSDNVFVHRTGFINDLGSEDYIDSLDNFCYCIEKLHQKHGFDLIHSYFLTPNGYIGTLTAKKLGLPSLVSVRGNDLGRNYLDYKKLFWIYWTLKNADYLTFLNGDLLETANIIYPCKEKSKVVTNSAYFPYSYSRKKVNPKKIIFGYWGDIKRKKGLAYLLKAVSQIPQKNFELRILGDIIDSDKQFYSDLVKKLKIEKRVSFHKSRLRCELANWVSKIDVFVLPTINDGCPNVIFEAMQMEKAIISTKIKAVSQILADKKDALLVNPRGAEELKEAMQYLIKNPFEIERLGSTAKKSLLAKYSVQNECNEFQKIYLGLVHA